MTNWVVTESFRGCNLAVTYAPSLGDETGGSIIWCAREDLNLQSLRNQILSLACLPFHHARSRASLRRARRNLKPLLQPDIARGGKFV